MRAVDVDSGMPGSRTAREGVIVPAIDAASSVACIRSLGRHGVPTVVVSELAHPPGFASKYATETVRVPDPTRELEAYGDILLGLARRRDVRTIIPVRESDIYLLAKHRDEFANHVGTPWVDLDRLRRVQDRVELFAAAEAADVGAPRTTPMDEWYDWDRPLVVKPRYTMHAPEYDDRFEEARIETRSAQYLEPGTVPSLEAWEAELGHVPLVQEYVPNTDEYAFFGLYEDGEAVATFQHRQRRAYKYVGGPSSFRESTDIPELDAAGRRLLEELEWDGLAMVEFLREPDTGEFVLMEVNPRTWTSLPFTVQAGVDFPYYYWLLATDQRSRIDANYEVGIAGHLLRGEALYLHSVLFEDYPLIERPSIVRAVREVAGSMVDHPRFDLLSTDDPRPFVRDALNTYQYARGRRETV